MRFPTLLIALSASAMSAAEPVPVPKDRVLSEATTYTTAAEKFPENAVHECAANNAGVIVVVGDAADAPAGWKLLPKVLVAEHKGYAAGAYLVREVKGIVTMTGDEQSPPYDLVVWTDLGGDDDYTRHLNETAGTSVLCGRRVGPDGKAVGGPTANGAAAPAGKRVVAPACAGGVCPVPASR